jgi:hypothetical protein
MLLEMFIKIGASFGGERTSILWTGDNRTILIMGYVEMISEAKIQLGGIGTVWTGQNRTI